MPVAQNDRSFHDTQCADRRMGVDGGAAVVQCLVHSSRLDQVCFGSRFITTNKWKQNVLAL